MLCRVQAYPPVYRLFGPQDFFHFQRTASRCLYYRLHFQTEALEFLLPIQLFGQFLKLTNDKV